MKRKYLPLAGVFVLAFVLAFGIAWLVLRPAEPAAAPAPAEAAARTLAAGDLDAFMKAVADGDFPAMRDLGEELFAEGNILPGSEALLAEHLTTSYSPTHRVYALYTNIGQDRTQRVILTLNDQDTVVSFMAEEMAIAK